MLKAMAEAKAAFLSLDSNKLKSVSDYTLHFAGIYQDPYSISVAVIVYSLAKIVERRKMRAYKQWDKFSRDVLDHLEKASNALRENNKKACLDNMKHILSSIGKLEAKFGEFVMEVIRKAKIKKGSAIYKHGLSAGRVAAMMGISPWELMEYLGQTKFADEMPMVTRTPHERMKEARRIFNIG